RPTLAEIYTASQDQTVKRKILQAYMETGDKEHLVTVAKSDSNADNRQDAIRYLSNMGARDEIWSLYAGEQSSDVKLKIIQSLYSDGYSDKVAELARNEKDPTLRKAAIRTLSHFRGHSDLLYNLYAPETNEQIKKEIINAM